MPYDSERKKSESQGQLGVLRLTATNQTLEYRAFELSACTLGIISRERLSPRDYLVLEHPLQRIPLRVLPSPGGREPGEPVDGQARYRLVCLDPGLQLDRLLLGDGGVGEGGGFAFQYARFVLHPKLYVEAWHPVSQATAMFESLNISRSGMLLRSYGPSVELESFRGKTPIEVRLDVAKLWLPLVMPAKCQIIRAYTERQGNQVFTCLGVRFTSFGVREAQVWYELLTRLERSEIPGSLCVRTAGFSPK